MQFFGGRGANKLHCGKCGSGVYKYLYQSILSNFVLHMYSLYEGEGDQITIMLIAIEKAGAGFVVVDG